MTKPLPMRPGRGRRNLVVVIGLTIFGGLTAAFPVWYASNGPRLTKGDKALVGETAGRGAYVNAGSKDIGRDPRAGSYVNRDQSV